MIVSGGTTRLMGKVAQEVLERLEEEDLVDGVELAPPTSLKDIRMTSVRMEERRNLRKLLQEKSGGKIKDERKGHGWKFWKREVRKRF